MIGEIIVERPCFDHDLSAWLTVNNTNLLLQPWRNERREWEDEEVAALRQMRFLNAQLGNCFEWQVIFSAQVSSLPAMPLGYHNFPTCNTFFGRRRRYVHISVMYGNGMHPVNLFSNVQCDLFRKNRQCKLIIWFGDIFKICPIIISLWFVGNVRKSHKIGHSNTMQTKVNYSSVVYLNLFVGRLFIYWTLLFVCACMFQ